MTDAIWSGMPDAWAVPNEDGGVDMLFPTRDEAATYCEPGEDPIPLHGPEKMAAAINAALAEQRRRYEANTEVLLPYGGSDGRRDWANAGAWLYPGDALCVLRAEK